MFDFMYMYVFLVNIFLFFGVLFLFYKNIELRKKVLDLDGENFQLALHLKVFNHYIKSDSEYIKFFRQT